MAYLLIYNSCESGSVSLLHTQKWRAKNIGRLQFSPHYSMCGPQPYVLYAVHTRLWIVHFLVGFSMVFTARASHTFIHLFSQHPVRWGAIIPISQTGNWGTEQLRSKVPTIFWMPGLRHLGPDYFRVLSIRYRCIRSTYSSHCLQLQLGVFTTSTNHTPGSQVMHSTALSMGPSFLFLQSQPHSLSTFQLLQVSYGQQPSLPHNPDSSPDKAHPVHCMRQGSCGKRICAHVVKDWTIAHRNQEAELKFHGQFLNIWLWSLNVLLT